jgi:hypothetical protein
MSERFNNSLEVRDIIVDLRRQLKRSRYNPDLHKLLNNLGEMNSQLSRLEVEARQTHKDHKVVAYKQQISQSIDYLEKMILILKLMD